MTNWANKRRFIYAAGTFIAIILVLVYAYRDTLFPAPSCFDTKQNGYESGIDCGGTCSLRCSSQITPLSVTWTQVIKTGSSTYDLVALVSNKNLDSAPRQVPYTFVAYDTAGKEIRRITGTTLAPIGGDFPVIVQNINFPATFASISATVAQDTPFYKASEIPTNPSVRVTSTSYEAGSIPRVYATVVNTTRLVLKDLELRAVLYDADGNAYAVGSTLIPVLGKEEMKQVVFTWHGAFSSPPTKTRVYPIINPFVGS